MYFTHRNDSFFFFSISLFLFFSFSLFLLHLSPLSSPLLSSLSPLLSFPLLSLISIPCDLIGVATSQAPIDRKSNDEKVTNHEELMSNFFAQADALAYGKTIEDLKQDNVPERLWPHKEFPGNRPSLSILMDRLDSFSLGSLLSLYEHRTAVQGFVWGCNSFDQWGVELGKSLASKVRKQLSQENPLGDGFESFNSSTRSLLTKFHNARK